MQQRLENGSTITHASPAFHHEIIDKLKEQINGRLYWHQGKCEEHSDYVLCGLFTAQFTDFAFHGVGVGYA
jgi:hypothetical protein